MTANNLFVLQICLGSIMHLYQQQKSNSPSDKKYYKCPLLYKALNPIPNTHTNRDLRTIVCFNFQTQNLQESHWHFLGTLKIALQSHYFRCFLKCSNLLTRHWVKESLVTDMQVAVSVWNIPEESMVRRDGRSQAGQDRCYCQHYRVQNGAG